ncbi:uncharacterized [Tachysurus ichikawai]
MLCSGDLDEEKEKNGWYVWRRKTFGSTAGPHGAELWREREKVRFGSKGHATSSEHQPLNIDMLMMCNSGNKSPRALTARSHNGP